MWDGSPVAGEPPYGTMIVVFRRAGADVELLVLHRCAAGPPGYAGDWAWTPPSGARRPGEAIDACAARELAEEVGLHLDAIRVDDGLEWAVYLAEAPWDAKIELDAEHDESRWLSIDETLAACKPGRVAEGVRIAARAIRHRG